MTDYVPNIFPTVNAPYRTAIIGEAPGKDEVKNGEPFVGASGRFLNSFLSRVGLNRQACYLGNICQYNPPGNDLSLFDWEGDEIQSSLAQLTLDMREFQPNLVLLLGNTALRSAKPPVGKPFSVMTWRGTLFQCVELNSPFYGRKCISTFHPAYVLRDYPQWKLFEWDVRRAAQQAVTPVLSLPKRNYIIPQTAVECIALLRQARSNRVLTSIDIEGYVLEFGGMSMISVAQKIDEGFVVPFSDGHGGSYWPTPEDEADVWVALSELLTDTEVPKLLQNSLYDLFVLSWSYGILVRGLSHDTMLEHWELYCEMEKGLDTLASIYTLEPYYKQERKSEDYKTKLEYCIKDSCVTLESHLVMRQQLERLPDSERHYRLNIALLYVFLYMELRGIRYDTTLAKDKRLRCLNMMYEYQHKLNRLSGRWLAEDADWFALAKAEMVYKKMAHLSTWEECVPWLKKHPTKDYPAIWARLEELSKGERTHIAVAEAEMICGDGLNVDSKAFKDYLYEDLHLPYQYNINPKTKIPSLSTDYEALMALYKICQRDNKSTQAELLDCAINIRELQTRADLLRITTDSDGRVRAGYNVVGTTTGRPSCRTSPTGSGYNLATMTKGNPLRPKGHPMREGMRDLFLADDGYDMSECDLEGADGWTMAAYCKTLGDPTMMDDLLAGLKPAKIMVLMLRHGPQVSSLPRAELLVMANEVEKECWEYFFSKEGVYGSSYLMGVDKLRRRVFINSEGKIDIDKATIIRFQNYFFLRYPGVKKWHAFRRRLHESKPVLTSPSGHRRIFLDRPEESLPEVCAHEPQNNTNYATHLASLRLWTDPTNRRPNGSLIVEPLHQVYDALITQWPQSHRDFGARKTREWFQNPFTIAGQMLTIPFEGGYGPSWKDTSLGKI